MKYALVFLLFSTVALLAVLWHQKDALTLKERGSFYVGGESVEQDFVELGSFRAADTVTINQMYVEYMTPFGKPKTPIVLVHGAGLSGACYDTTPDGRTGWFDYFVRKGFPTYLVDQVGRARSGFNQAIFNNVGAGKETPDKLPKILRMADLHSSWINFRIGTAKGVPFPDTQFPVEAVSNLSRMSIADLSSSLGSPNPNYKTLAELADKLNGAVIIGHSQSGHYPLESALIAPDKVKGMVLLEPGTCAPRPYSDEQIATFAKIPLLVMFGDHLEGSTEGAPITWRQRFDQCNALIDRVNQAGGKARMVHLPEKGMRGNTHMLMQDKNNLAVADVIIDWIKRRVR